MNKGMIIGGVLFGIVAIMLLLAVATPMISEMAEDVKVTPHRNTGEDYQLVEISDKVEITLSSHSENVIINDRPYVLKDNGVSYVVSDNLMVCRSGTQHIIWSEGETVAITIDPAATEVKASIVIDNGSWTLTSGETQKSGTYTWLYHVGGAAGNYIQVEDVRDHFVDAESLIIYNHIGEISLITTPAKAGDRQAATEVWGDPSISTTKTTWVFEPSTAGDGQIWGIVYEITGDQQNFTALIPLKYYTTEENSTSMIIGLIPLMLAIIVLIFIVMMFMRSTNTKNEL